MQSLQNSLLTTFLPCRKLQALPFLFYNSQDTPSLQNVTNWYRGCVLIAESRKKITLWFSSDFQGRKRKMQSAVAFPKEYFNASY